MFAENPRLHVKIDGQWSRQIKHWSWYSFWFWFSFSDPITCFWGSHVWPENENVAIHSTRKSFGKIFWKIHQYKLLMCVFQNHYKTSLDLNFTRLDRDEVISNMFFIATFAMKGCGQTHSFQEDNVMNTSRNDAGTRWKCTCISSKNLKRWLSQQWFLITALCWRTQNNAYKRSKNIYFDWFIIRYIQGTKRISMDYVSKKMAVSTHYDGESTGTKFIIDFLNVSKSYRSTCK